MVAILDYGMGNLGSIRNMLLHIHADARIISDPADISSADCFVLPGVGSFDQGMKSLDTVGFRSVLNEEVREKGKPILGVCLGMQLFGEASEEGERRGLGWIDAESVRFSQEEGKVHAALPVPHMGWNGIDAVRQDPIIEGLGDDTRFYFLHSYHLECRSAGDVIARTDYGYAFPSIVRRGNIVGVQFHPEKSHRFGMRIFKNFLQMVGNDSD